MQVWSAPELLTSEKGLPYFRDVRTPALEELKRERRPRALGGDPPGEWGGQIDVAVFNGGPLFTEVAFLHKSSGASLSRPRVLISI